MSLCLTHQVLIGAAGGLLLAYSVQAGNLNPPPGPIQATDRIRLDAQQISLPHTISQPGSYVLTSNFVATIASSGFRIDSDDVTLGDSAAQLRHAKALERSRAA